MAGDDLCAQGHIGANCKSCDYYGEKWGQRYSSSSN